MLKALTWTHRHKVDAIYIDPPCNIDPHGFHLADALPKLQGVARYAESHSQIYRRIEAIAEVGGKLRLLNLTRADVRQAVMDATSAQTLYQSAVAGDYA